MLSNHLILCRPLLLPPSIFPSIRVFSNESVIHISGQRIGISASTSVLPVNTQDWFPLGFDLLAVQGAFKSLLQHHNSKALHLQHSAFCKVQSSHTCVTNGKTIVLTIQTFVGKVMSLHFNMLSRFVTAFLPRSKCLLISWLQSPSVGILESKKIKFFTVSIYSPLFATKWWDWIPWSKLYTLLFHPHEEAPKCFFTFCH